MFFSGGFGLFNTRIFLILILLWCLPYFLSLLKFTLVVDHDTTLHGVHIDTVPSVLLSRSSVVSVINISH